MEAQAMHQSTTIIAVELSAGVLSHVLYFNKGEHHLYPARPVLFYLCSIAAAVGLLVTLADLDLSGATKEALIGAAWYFTGLYVSLLTYRLFLHPLNKFPGPWVARISEICLAPNFSKGDAHLHFQRYHEKYGDYVRFGSSELSIADARAVDIVFGFGNKCKKAAWYDGTYPQVSMQLDRDRASHAKRRRVWSAAFSDKALRGYEERMRAPRDKLWEKLAGHDGQPVNITKWFDLYAWDIMGDMAFGKSFNMLDTQEHHWAVQLINDGSSPLRFHMPIWVMRLIISIPGVMKDFERMVSFCAQRLVERIDAKVSTPDVMSALLDPYKGRKPVGREMENLVSDSQLIIIAGSDTTSSTMTNVCMELCRHPTHITKLREEIAPHIDANGHASSNDLAKLDHLNAIIHETLRIHPPVPLEMLRITPPEGLQIGDVHVPGDMTISIPQYVIGRNKAAYVRPTEFIPDRWYSQPELVLNKQGFAPFSIGSTNCIGKPLAMMNMRVTLAEMVHKFDMSFAPGEDGKGIDERSFERVVCLPPELKLSLRRRSAAPAV